MKRITFVLLSAILFSSCAWFISKPKIDDKEIPTTTEDGISADIRAEAESYVSNGITYHQNKKDSLAILSWKKALELIPGDAEVHNFLGISYHKMNKLDDAIVQFKIATELDPQYYHAYNNLGFLLFLQGKYHKAQKLFKTSLSINPDFQPAKLNLQKVNAVVDGKLSWQVFELSERAERVEDLNQKIEKYVEILTIDPGYAEGHNNIAVAYYYNDEVDSAYAHLNTALKIRKNYPEAINNLGYIYKVAGRYDDAIKFFLMAVSSKKEYLLALNNLGETYQLNNEFENARRVFKTVLDIDPANEFAKDSFENLLEGTDK